MGDVLRLDRKLNYKIRADEARSEASKAVSKYRSDRKVVNSSGEPESSQVELATIKTRPTNPGLNRAFLEPPSDLWLQAETCSTMAEQTPAILDNLTLLSNNSTRAKMYRALQGIEPSLLERLKLRIRDIFIK